MKVRLKMTLCMLGLLSLLFGLGGSLLISVSFQNGVKHEEDVAYNSYRMVLGTLQIVNSLERRWDDEYMTHTMEQLDRQKGSGWIALRLSSAEGTIYESGNAGTYLGPVSELPESGKCLFHSISGASGEQYLALSGAVSTSDGTLYLHTVHDITFLYESRQAQLQAYRWVFLGLCALCALLAYTVSRLLTAPLDALSHTSRAIASGRLACRVPIRSADEIGTVSADFNAMADRLEEMVSELQNAVERQERFMGGFAHELKTPMTSIIGYADLLRGGTLTPAERTEAADYIFSEGKRLERLSHKLLELLVLKTGDLSMSCVRPADLIWAVTEEFKPALPDGISITCRCEDGLCFLETDLVRSLLFNLVDNARKALDGTGAIMVCAEMLPDGVVISVCDNGRGIPPEALAHLTQAFYRVDKSRSREQGGVGLGLALCREIVALHHGKLSVESELGSGTCVYARLRGGRP